ncbi:MAG: tetratricopeptide repeat protein, partial [Syntrophales bacterium]|nr:tetratricopeptide repeat protein [Syntrophales bacterium]
PPMKKIVVSFLSITLMFITGLLWLGTVAHAQQAPALQEAIRQYQAENYEEAIDLLIKLRGQEPRSALTAFFLGMAYKQTNAFSQAEIHLTDAATLPPPVREAPVELIDVLYRQGKVAEAKKWVEIAERNEIFPAKVAFLKGMIAASEGQYPQAVAAFENAKKIDPAYTQSADVQIGVCYMNMRKYDLAKQRFQAAITQDPLSDLGSFARRYQDLVEERSFLERPLRVTLGILGQYDTNVLAEPTYNYAWFKRTGTDFWERDEKSFKLLTTARLDYIPLLTGPFTFNASYAAAAGFQEKYATSYNLITNTFSVNPGIVADRFMLIMAGNYTHNMKRNPSYSPYSESYTIGPMLRIMATSNHIFEVSVAYTGKNYFEEVAQPELWDQSSRGMEGYVNWYWLYGTRGGMLNLRYTYSQENAKGDYFDNYGQRFTLNILSPKYWVIRAQVGGEIFLQDYKTANATFDGTKRRDQTYSLTAGLYWDVNKYFTVIAPQYAKTRGFSNLFIYDYDRDVYSAGVEIRF